MIDWVSHGKFSVFSVEKYDDYQSNFVPADYQQITTSKPAIPMPASNTVPADYQQITTDKEYNNIISNTDVLEVPQQTKSLTRKNLPLAVRMLSMLTTKSFLKRQESAH